MRSGCDRLRPDLGTPALAITETYLRLRYGPAPAAADLQAAARPGRALQAMIARFAVIVVCAIVAAPAAAETRPGVTSLLGRPLVAQALAPEAEAEMKSQLADAIAAWEKDRNDADALIWVGRRTAYLGRYREAIDIFSDGIARHPADARMYRHRGHRYLTIREIDKAIADFEKAVALIAGQPDQVEPDGLPNARNIPTSTLHSNIYYHLALGYYLKGDFSRAAETWTKARDCGAERRQSRGRQPLALSLAATGGQDPPMRRPSCRRSRRISTSSRTASITSSC